MLHFGNYPIDYWIAGYLLAGTVMISAVYRKIPVQVFLPITLILVVLKRLPAIVYNRELNPDESPMLSHALTLFQDPVYWRSVDGLTIGPLDNYLLVIPRLLGFQLDYTSARIMGLLCLTGSLLFLFFSMRNWFGEKIARVALLLPVIFLSFTQETDFVHYSIEQLPVFLLAVMLWLLTKITKEAAETTNRTTIHYYYLLGFVAGTIPFAKLQAVPLAMVIILYVCWICLDEFQKSGTLRNLMTLITGGITFPIFVSIWAAYFHVLDDLIDFYIYGNIIYADANVQDGFVLNQFLKIVGLSVDFTYFTCICLVLMVTGIIRMAGDVRKSGLRENAIPVAILALALAGIYAVTRSGNDFTHYLNFSIIPWTLLSAYGMQKLSRWRIVFPILFLLWFCYKDTVSYEKSYSINDFVSDDATSLKQSPVVKELKKYTKEKDYMVVWGWQCTYYVEAQLAQGTAENHSERSIFKHAMLEKYRSRYLADIQRTKPAVFLDAVGKNSLWVKDKRTQGFQTFLPLAEYIHLNYTFKGTLEDTELYVRNDRL